MCDGSDDSQSRTKPRSIAAVTSLFTGMTKIKISVDSNSLMLKFQNRIAQMMISNTVKSVLSGHSKIAKTKVLKTNGSLM